MALKFHSLTFVFKSTLVAIRVFCLPVPHRVAKKTEQKALRYFLWSNIFEYISPGLAAAFVDRLETFCPFKILCFFLFFS